MAEPSDTEWKKVFGNAMLILAVLPKTGDNGEFACPCCKTGTVYWGRARSNGHVRFRCDGCDTALIQ